MLLLNKSRVIGNDLFGSVLLHWYLPYNADLSVTDNAFIFVVMCSLIVFWRSERKIWRGSRLKR